MTVDTRVRILDIAERLVMQRGYHAFSYQHIADELGIRSPAVHYHFRTKPGLVSAMLDRYTLQFRSWAADLGDATPVQQVDAYLDLSRGFVKAGRVCALGMMGAEFNAVPEELQARTLDLQAEIFDWLAAVLSAGRADESLRFSGTAESKAAEIGCAALGAQQLGRIRGLEAFEGVAAQIGMSLTEP